MWRDVAIGAGAALLIGAGGWRVTAGRRARARVALALVSDDPARRRAGVQLAAQQGLSHHLDALVALSRAEPDPGVRLELARIVERSQWMPPDERMVELRLWAQPILDAETPEPSAAPAAEPVVASPEPESSPTTPAAAAPAPAPVAPLVPPVSESASVRAVILVTGAGGPAGISVIRALMRRPEYRVAAVDADEWAAGLALAHAGQVVPRADAPDFAERLATAAADANAAVLVPTVAEEMLLILRHRDLFDGLVRMWLPSAEALARCLDKVAFHKSVAAAGISTPATNAGSGEGVPGPWIVKPRFGRGSRQVESADNDAELSWALYRVQQPIVQTRLEGREFTADVLVAPDHRLLGCVPRWRVQTKAGISTQGLTFYEEEVVKAVAATVAAVGMEGPANVQGFMAPDGSVSIVELNPRFSGGLPLSLAAGCDLVGQYVGAILGDPVDPSCLRYRTGVRMSRYFDEVFEG